MPRAIWTGAIGFGLVTVPVKLYSALDRKSVRFHQLSGKSGVRVVQKRVDPQTGEEVPYEEIVKGYEIAPERYVVIAPGELDSLQPKKTQDDRDRGLRRARADRSDLLRAPLLPRPRDRAAPSPTGCCWRRCSRTAGWRSRAFVMRSKEQLVAIRPMGDVLEMATMLFADEVLAPERIGEIAELAEVKTTKRELDVARQLVDSLAGDFDPDAYRDSYREEVLALIERKAQGEEIAVQPAPGRAQSARAGL